MKDKTHDMNRGYGTEEAEAGFDRLPDSEMASSRDRKRRQIEWAGLEDNEAMRFIEQTSFEDEDYPFGFLARNNYGDRY